MKIKNLLLLFLVLLFTSTLFIECGNSSKYIFSFDYFKDFSKGVIHYVLKTFSLTKKDRLDSVVGKHWNDWTVTGKDSTKYVIDFAEIMPFEWDSLIYLNSSSNFNNNSDKLKKYINDYDLIDLHEYVFEGLHFLKEGEIVYEIDLFMASDDENGVCFCTHKDIIKRSRNNAKFHIVKKGAFYVVLDMTEEHAPIWRYD